MNNDMKKSLKLFKALGDRNRLRIIKVPQHKNSRCVCEICEVLGIGQPTTSRHLRILEEAGLIVSTREGKWVNYSLVGKSGDDVLDRILTLLSGLMNDDPQVLSDVRKVESIDRCILCK
jgi:ArsR family transcriptional regulator, arsenate/arsenite/antimonite-responsive transcriptional repressor